MTAMTTADPFAPAAGPDVTEDLLRRATAPAAAAAAVLPAAAPLTPGAPDDGTSLGALVQLLPGAAVAQLTSRSGGLAVLVGADLVAALAGGVPGLDLGAAVQPALDAAAAALGISVERALTVESGLVPTQVPGPVVVVPLLTRDGVGAAVVVSAAALAGAGAPAAAATGPSPFTPDATFQPRTGLAGGAGLARGLEMLHGVDMELTVELGRTRMSVRELLSLAPGDVLELDRAAGSPADLLVNGRLIARGEVVVVDEDFGLRVTEILDTTAG